MPAMMSFGQNCGIKILENVCSSSPSIIRREIIKYLITSSPTSCGLIVASIQPHIAGAKSLEANGFQRIKHFSNLMYEDRHLLTLYALDMTSIHGQEMMAEAKIL